MNYVVGDVHAEVGKLLQLLKHVLKLDSNPSFVFIGDYIDKGENAKSTLDLLVSISHDFPCIFLWGNHEYCWMNAFEYEEYLLKYGGRNTMKSFGCQSVSEMQEVLLNSYGQLFNSLKDYYILDPYFITHSGVHPDDYFIEELKMIGQSSFLFNRYSFLNQRCLFQNKYKVIFGHTGFFQPYVDPFKIGIDTGACYSEHQPLTCFCTDTGTFINSNGEAYLLINMSYEYCPNILRNKPWRIDD